MKIVLTFVFLLLTTFPAVGADFYIDPINGSDENSGDSENPWKSLQRLFDEGFIQSRNWDALPYKESSVLVIRNKEGAIQAGDTIHLRSGTYGELKIVGMYNSGIISLKAASGHTPIFRNILVRSSSNWRLEGLTVNSAQYPEAGFSKLIALETHNWTGPVEKITVKYCKVFSTKDSSSWSRQDWNNRAKNGISVSGRSMHISYNTLKNVNFGISVGASNSLIEWNSVENFAGDGLRGLGDYTTFQYNTVKNCYDVNDNHDDGFQSWSVGTDGKVGTGVVKGIVLRGNTIINYEDPKQPFRGTLQGIGCFDGMFEGWIVEKNRVIVDHWHGISFYGAKNTIIKNNIVTDPNGKDNIGPPWIMLRAHKNGTPASSSQITCNIAPKFIISDDETIVNQFNTLSLTGEPLHSQCRAQGVVNLILPTILLKDQGKDDF